MLGQTCLFLGQNLRETYLFFFCGIFLASLLGAAAFLRWVVPEFIFPGVLSFVADLVALLAFPFFSAWPETFPRLPGVDFVDVLPFTLDLALVVGFGLVLALIGISHPLSM